MHEIVTAENPCDWGAKYESVVGTGTAEFIESKVEKARGLVCIFGRYGGSFNEFRDTALATVVVIRVNIVSISGKEKK